MYAFLFRDLISWLFCIYWHFMQLMDCFSFHCVILFERKKCFWWLYYEWYFGKEGMFTLSINLKSDKFFHICHLICCHLYINKYLFQETCKKRTSLNVSQAFSLKTKLLSHLLYIFICMLMAKMVLICCKSHCILLGSRWNIPINPSKWSYCFLNINCYFTDITFFIFLF